jgi:lipopolysaccharide cholinephosphotransferase
MEKEKLNSLHKVILEIALDFDIFCKENNIIYYLMGGSALGAMRHQGFIPWDDDFDVFMDRDNYLKFIRVAKSKLDTKKYYFQEEDTNEWPLFFSKIRMNNTTFIEKDVAHRVMHHGIYIDIMCLNNAFENKLLRYFQYLSARFLSASVLGRRGYSTKSIFKGLAIKISSIVIIGFIKKSLLKFVRSQNLERSKLVGHFFGRAPFSKTTFLTSYLSTPRYVMFNELLLPVPKDVEKYLEVRYGGEWMNHPSQKEINKYPSHAYITDTKKDYKHYLNQVKG